MKNARNRVIVLVALTLSASACATILGIDDVTVRDAGESTADASVDTAIAEPIADAGADALQAYALEVLADAPIGYWRLGDPNIVAANFGTSGNGSGTYGDAVTHTTDGGLITDPKNEAAIFPGISDGSTQLQGVSIAKDSPFEQHGSTLTIEVWVEPLAEVGDNRIGELVSYGSSVFGPFEAWALRSAPPDVAFYTSCCGQVMTTKSLLRGSIYHLVATFDHGTQRIYINGLPDSNSAGGGTTDLVFDGSTDGLGIGATWAGYNPFNGILDEVAVYDYVLPPDRIATHYRAGLQ